jgi:hypothetical protein
MGRERGATRTARTRTSNEWLKRNPNRRLAQQAVKRAKKRGDLVGRGYCTFCLKVAETQFHHPDIGYDSRHDLDVLEVCDPCHRKWHKGVDRLLKMYAAMRER